MMLILVLYLLFEKKNIKADILVGYVFRKSYLANKIFSILEKKQLGKIKEVEVKASSFLLIGGKIKIIDTLCQLKKILEAVFY